MRFYRCARGARFNAFAIFLAPAFFFARDFSDRYPLRPKAGISFFLSQPSIAGTSRASLRTELKRLGPDVPSEGLDRKIDEFLAERKKPKN